MLMNDPSRIQRIEAALKAEAKKAEPERIKIRWRESSERLIVVDVPLDLVLLNPNSHRIQAQLQSHDRYEQIKASPFTEESQEIIAELLREPSDAFEELKQDLRINQQQDPGVITREGVLVNANRRSVALRDLDKTHIRVVVLPGDADSRDINELELRLQIKRELREDYTFTNTLLFIRDCLKSGWSYEKVAKELGYGAGEKSVEKVRQMERILALIEELRDKSGKRFKYQDFDSSQQALEELDKKYEDLKKSDAGAAQRLRTNRLVGILTGAGYRELRSVDADFGVEYLEEAIRDHEELQPIADQLLAGSDKPSVVSGVDELFGSLPEADQDAGAVLYNWVLDTAGSSQVLIRMSGVKLDRREVVEDIGEAFVDAAKAAQAVSKRESAIEAPRNRVKDANKKVQAARQALKKALSDPEFSLQVSKRLEADANKLARAVKSLQTEISQAVEAKSKGTSRKKA